MFPAWAWLTCLPQSRSLLSSVGLRIRHGDKEGMKRPIVMFVTGGEILHGSGQSSEAVVRAVVSLAFAWAKAGVDIVQIREAWLSDRGLLELVRLTVDRLSRFTTKVIVNDRLDIALSANADGIHLKDQPLPMERIRPYWPSDWLVGRSVHDVNSVNEINGGGYVDYVLAGTVKSTLSKPGRTPLGFHGLKRIAAASNPPVIGIGGLEFSDSLDVAKATASGIAGVRLFMNGAKLTDDERERQVEQCRYVFDSN